MDERETMKRRGMDGGVGRGRPLLRLSKNSGQQHTTWGNTMGLKKLAHQICQSFRKISNKVKHGAKNIFGFWNFNLE